MFPNLQGTSGRKNNSLLTATLGLFNFDVSKDEKRKKIDKERARVNQRHFGGKTRSSFDTTSFPGSSLLVAFGRFVFLLVFARMT